MIIVDGILIVFRWCSEREAV